MEDLKNLLSYIFSNKRTLVYTTFQQEDYFTVSSKLVEQGIGYRVAAFSQTPSVGSPAHRYEYMVEFKFYVNKYDRHAAEKAIYG